MTLNEYIQFAKNNPNPAIAKSLGGGQVLIDYLRQTPHNTNYTVAKSINGSAGDNKWVSNFETEPYLIRQSPNMGHLYNLEYDEIVGASVGWNQLVSSGATSVTVMNGHKYYSLINNVASVNTSDGTAITINDSSKDMVVDITLMLGSTIANYVANLGSSSGVAWLKKYFPKLFTEYQPYDAGSIKSVNGLTSHVMRDSSDNIIGSYPLDPSITLRGQYKLDNDKLYAVGDVWKSNGEIKREYVELTFHAHDNYEWNIILAGDSTKFFFTRISDKNIFIDNEICCNRYEQTIIDSTNDNIGINIVNSKKYNAAYIYFRPEEAETMTMIDFFNMLKANPITVILKLVHPTTEMTTSYTNPQICDNNGTEEYVTTNIIPVGHNTKYIER